MSFEKVPTGKGDYQLEMANQRATIRYHCAPATPGQVKLSDDHEYQRGWVQDLCTGGVGLLLSRPIVAGTNLLISLKSVDGQQSFNLEARVVHSTQQPTGDWVVGCALSNRLSEDELDCLLYD